MSGSAFLHIQDRESGPIRVVELPWISVRVGRAGSCEVRLPGEGLPAEACRLQRRGESWFLAPVGAAGPVEIDGRPLEKSCPLPFDVPFTIGPYTLVLRSHQSLERSRDAARPAPRAWRSPGRRGASLSTDWDAATPLPEPAAPVLPRAEVPPAPAPAARPASSNPWEARWRAAAARLRPEPAAARAEAPATPTPSYPRPEPYRSVPLKGSQAVEPKPTVTAPPAWKPPEWVAPARMVDVPALPSNVATEGAVGEAESEAITPPPPPSQGGEFWEPQDTLSPFPPCEGGTQGGIEPQSVAVESTPPSPEGEFSDVHDVLSEFFACEGGTEDDSGTKDEAKAEVITPPTPPSQGGEFGLAEEPEILPPVPAGPGDGPHRLIVTAEAAPGMSIRQDVLPPAGLGAGDPLAVSVVMSPLMYPEPEPPRPEVRTATLLEAEAAPEPKRKPEPERDSEPRPRPGSRRDAVEPDLPSARDILAAAARPAPARDDRTRPAAAWERAAPTLAQEPAHWSLPAWLAWPPAALLVLAMGAGGSYLAVHWARDASNAAVVAQRLLAQDATAASKPLPEGVDPPAPAWWKTTPRHLAEWGVYLGRAPWGEDDEPPANPEELLDAAVRIAPLHPVARLARAQHGRGPDAPERPAGDLGLSRDAVSLGWSARTLRREGKKEAALRIYRQALEVACRPDRAAAEELSFSDDPGVRRYLLPGEATALPIVRELVEDPEWSFADWSPAVPPGTAAALATARLLNEQGRAEAKTLLEGLAEPNAGDAASGGEPATRLAIRAEACALLARWKEAEQAYRQAIDEADDPTTRRSWWFNLANVAAQLDDQRQRDAALQAALDVATSDDISRRALELQRSSEPLSRLRPGGTRAN